MKALMHALLSIVSPLENQEPGNKRTGEAATLVTGEVIPQKSLADCGNVPGTDEDMQPHDNTHQACHAPSPPPQGQSYGQGHSH